MSYPSMWNLVQQFILSANGKKGRKKFVSLWESRKVFKTRIKGPHHEQCWPKVMIIMAWILTTIIICTYNAQHLPPAPICPQTTSRKHHMESCQNMTSSWDCARVGRQLLTGANCWTTNSLGVIGGMDELVEFVCSWFIDQLWSIRSGQLVSW